MVVPSVDYTEIQKSISTYDMEDMYREVNRLKELTAHIPIAARKESGGFEKAYRNLSDQGPSRGPKSAFFDPLSLQYAMGYKDRRYSLTYDVLKRCASQLSIVAAIINTRVAQIASFAAPYRTTKSLGFMVKHKDPEHMTTKSEREFIKHLEAFISDCGEPGRKNPYSRTSRDDFETFIKKIVRDTLVYDQLCHPAGTEIELDSGSIKFIEDIVVGDVVRTHTGCLKPVVELKRRFYSGRMIRVKSGCQIVEATLGHPLLAVTDKWFRLSSSRPKNIKPKWVLAENLTSDCYLVYPKPKLSEQDDEFFYIKVNSVETYEVEDLPVFNFEVEEDHSYIANGFVSHNCLEIVPRNNGIPFEFLAIDASTIRIASTDRDSGIGFSYHTRNPVAPLVGRFSALYENKQYGALMGGGYNQVDPVTDHDVQYVQIVNGQIENVYSENELAFGVRNPRTDLYIQGYGYGEIEQLITIVTSLLYSEEYNRLYFQQGSHPKGLLNFKGDNWTPDQLEAFRRQWISSVSGVSNCLAGDTVIWTDQGATRIDEFLGDSQEKSTVIWTGKSWESALVYRTKEKKQLCKTILKNG
ncbi:hypothetical protein MUP01_07045, partial [Candidatus Bathyarchaeota archaeon]|nr:hypothetical protein [Candidatus Bathyarchaeota archaeon]